MNQPTRERILDAAERLMRSIGLARVTTKQIAQAAGCSEGALYKHFSSKEELFVRVLEERLPSLDPLLAELSSDPGDRSITDCVAVIARQAARFYESTFAIGASLFAEPSLLDRHRDAIRTLGTGPHRPLDAVADYLRTEQNAKRLRTDASAEAAAALLMGACYHRAVLHALLRQTTSRVPRQLRHRYRHDDRQRDRHDPCEDRRTEQDDRTTPSRLTSRTPNGMDASPERDTLPPRHLNVQCHLGPDRTIWPRLRARLGMRCR